MIDTALFGIALRERGFNFFTGVPCSHLEPLINDTLNNGMYVMATNEGDAVALAAGAHIGGKKTVVLMQNSGLTNAVSPLTSLNYNFRIPVLGFVSFRGEPGISDEPQHELMGQITPQMLDLMQVKWEFLSLSMEEIADQLDRACAVLDQNTPFFFVVKKDTFLKTTLQAQSLPQALSTTIFHSSAPDAFPTRYDSLTCINQLKTKSTVIVATTGKTGRELYTIEDSEQHLYMVGSMGCVSAVGMGIAMSKPTCQVITIDGDGALLMRLGVMATNAAYHPPNLLHIVLDNNTHDSTGGQFTVSHNVNFTQIGAAVGYPRCVGVSTLEALTDEILQWFSFPQLTCLVLKIAKGSISTLGRPKSKPYQVKERLCRFLTHVD